MNKIILTIAPKELGAGTALDISLTNFVQHETKNLFGGIIQKIFIKKII